MPYTKKFAETLYNPAWLADEYVGKQRSAADLAKEIGTDASAVLRRLQRYGIPVRSNSEAQLLTPHGGSHAPRPRKAKDTLHNEGWLRERYEKEGFNASEIARLVGVEPPSVFGALRKFGIEVKTRSGAKKGKPNPNRRVPLNTACKSTLMNRANEVCPPGPCGVCGGPGAVHHIDRNRKNVSPSNLERLCSLCHGRQHRLEGMVAIKVLRRKFEVPTLVLHLAVREALGVCPTDDGCAVCGRDEDLDVNHKDRNHSNDLEENRERLCRKHHTLQHRREEAMAIRMLHMVYNFPIQRVHSIARRLLLKIQ